MAAKKKSLLPDDVDLDLAKAKPGEAAPQPFIHEAPVAVPGPAAPAVVDPRGLKEKAVNMSVYLLPDDHRRLRHLAVDEDCSVQTLMLEAIDLLLARRGLPPVTRWEPRRKQR